MEQWSVHVDINQNPKEEKMDVLLSSTTKLDLNITHDALETFLNISHLWEKTKDVCNRSTR